MRPFDHVVVSGNESPLYLGLWPSVAYAYRTLFPGVEVTLALVTERHPDDPFIEHLRLHGTVVCYPPVRGIPQAAQAKLARYYCAAGRWGVVLVDDLDQIPIDREWHLGKLSQRRPNTMFLIGAEVYGTQYPDQAPAGMMTAEVSVWKSLFNPEGWFWPSWILQLSHRSDLRPHTNLRTRANHEGRNDTTHQSLLGPLFSDEALIASLRKEHPVEVTSVPRGYTVGVHTIDRGSWPFSSERLEAGGYLSAHVARPFEHPANRPGIEAIVDYIRRRYGGGDVPAAVERVPSVTPDMQFGGSGLVQEAFEWITQRLPAGANILELGSGHSSTNYLSRYYQVTSIEDNIEYVNLYPSHYIYAPLVDDKWYDRRVLAAGLSDPRVKGCTPFDLLIIDGPVGGERRLGILPYLDTFIGLTKGPIMVDDTWRAEENHLAGVISKRVGRPVERFEYFSVI